MFQRTCHLYFKISSMHDSITCVCVRPNGGFREISEPPSAATAEDSALLQEGVFFVFGRVQVARFAGRGGRIRVALVLQFSEILLCFQRGDATRP